MVQRPPEVDRNKLVLIGRSAAFFLFQIRGWPDPPSVLYSACECRRFTDSDWEIVWIRRMLALVPLQVVEVQTIGGGV